MTKRRYEVLSLLVKEHSQYERAICSVTLGRTLASEGLVTRNRGTKRDALIILTITAKGIQVMANHGHELAKVMVSRAAGESLGARALPPRAAILVVCSSEKVSN